jgi:hypothetical protein
VSEFMCLIVCLLLSLDFRSAGNFRGHEVGSAR